MSDADRPARPVVLGPGEGEHVGATVGVTIKATEEDTGGSFYLGETELPAGTKGPPPHTHQRLTDMFYVLEGTLTARVGDETRELPAGSFACFPPGVVHTFWNASDAPVRFLNFNTPGGFEHYMRELGQLLSGPTPPSPADIGRLASKYDFQLAE